MSKTDLSPQSFYRSGCGESSGKGCVELSCNMWKQRKSLRFEQTFAAVCGECGRTSTWLYWFSPTGFALVVHKLRS